MNTTPEAPGSSASSDATSGRFGTGRRKMIDAFVAVSVLAHRAGADPDEITAAHGRFFDGNIAVKSAYGAQVLLAAIAFCGRCGAAAPDAATGPDDGRANIGR